MDNVKAYYRKAAALKDMKKYAKAMQSAEQGRKHAANIRQQVSHNHNKTLCSASYKF